jgi:hypothetical protein
VVDVTDVGLVDDNDNPVNELTVIALSMGEYQVLKAEPEIAKLSGQDRDELLGIRITFEMLAKADHSLRWSEYKQLPIATLTGLAGKIAEVFGGEAGGVLGES